jgi:hypothetical protein
MTSKTYQVSYTEAKLRQGVGILLWGVSALLSLHLFLSFSDKSLFQTLLLGATALGLEATKILTWRNPRTRVFAIVLILLSITASLGAALEVIDSSKGIIQTSNIQQDPVYQTRKADLASLDSEISTLVTRLGVLPPDYTTAASKITATVTERRASRMAIQESLTGLSERYSTSQLNTMFVLLGRFLHKAPEVIMFIILLVMAGSLEAGGILLLAPVLIRQKQAVNERAEAPAGKHSQVASQTPKSPSYDRPMTHEKAKPNAIGPEEFLEAAKCDGPYLRGRDVTAKSLGISFGEAKRLVSSLISDGRIKVYGKRLVLNEPKAS